MVSRLSIASTLDTMLKTICTDAEQAQLLSSLLKAVFLDMSLAVDSYAAAYNQRLEENPVGRFARAMRGANDGIWEWEIDSDRLHVSNRWLEIPRAHSKKVRHP